MQDEGFIGAPITARRMEGWYGRVYEIQPIEGGCLFNAYSSLEELSDCSNIQRVVEYSRGSNRIIEIVEVDASRQMISTHYHADMFPLLVICQNEFLFSERRKEILQERYLDLLQSISKMQALYDQIVDELELLIRMTVAYFSDFSGNNLIANDDFSDFRIIDVGSLTDFSNPITFSAQDLFLGRKFETERYAVDNILRAFQRYPELRQHLLSQVGKIEIRTICGH